MRAEQRRGKDGDEGTNTAMGSWVEAKRIARELECYVERGHETKWEREWRLRMMRMLKMVERMVEATSMRLIHNQRPILPSLPERSTVSMILSAAVVVELLTESPGVINLNARKPPKTLPAASSRFTFRGLCIFVAGI
jgi:hypothetical protein